jgi:hypothetical protein
MFTILMLALVSDLTVTPALLYSRLGRLFLPGAVRQQQTGTVPTVEPAQEPRESDRRDSRAIPTATCAE